MTTRELIQAEIDRLSEVDLEALYSVVQEFMRSRSQVQGESILEKLQRIQFDGPQDLAANHDLYLSGEKHEEPDIH
jgi:hypothetical protein